MCPTAYGQSRIWLVNPACHWTRKISKPIVKYISSNVSWSFCNCNRGISCDCILIRYFILSSHNVVHITDFSIFIICIRILWSNGETKSEIKQNKTKQNNMIRWCFIKHSRYLFKNKTRIDILSWPSIPLQWVTFSKSIPNYSPAVEWCKKT